MWILDFIRKLFSRTSMPGWQDGFIPSPIDYRDVLLGQVSKDKTPLPNSYRIPYVLTIKDQKSTPHCVGFSSATVKEERERREGNFIDFDGSWIYQRCKEIDNRPDIRGTYFRAGLKVLQKIGAKPLNSNEFEPYRIGGYIQVPLDENSLKLAIREYGAVLAGFHGSNQGWKGAYIRPPKSGEKVWGHAVALVGWDGSYIIGQNSYSEKWGDNGYFYFNKNYMPIDAWAVLIDLPNNWKELLNDEKDKPKYYFGRNLSYGLKKDNDVIALQKCLKWLGCFPSNIASSGNFLSITKKSVIIFQERYSISPSVGYFGPISRAKMNEMFAY